MSHGSSKSIRVLSIGKSNVPPYYPHRSLGIGFQTVKYLANAGAKVYMGARSESKAKTAIDQIHTENSEIAKGNIIWLPIDLADLHSVVRAAEIVRSKESRLDVLSELQSRGRASFPQNSVDIDLLILPVGHMFGFGNIAC